MVICEVSLERNGAGESKGLLSLPLDHRLWAPRKTHPFCYHQRKTPLPNGGKTSNQKWVLLFDIWFLNHIFFKVRLALEILHELVIHTWWLIKKKSLLYLINCFVYRNKVCLRLNKMSDAALDFLKPSWVLGKAGMLKPVALKQRKSGLSFTWHHLTKTQTEGHQDCLKRS